MRDNRHRDIGLSQLSYSKEKGMFEILDEVPQPIEAPEFINAFLHLFYESEEIHLLATPGQRRMTPA
jgi:hypothetical protein